ncbi:MAG TPA: hypothetical protein VM656_14980, partial [Pyrinomonadaceae bacterium]|nr:hypothetical protein [Pyrinomonadaceae bacterium]
EKDLKKAVWYIQREIGRLSKLHGTNNPAEEHVSALTPTANGAREAPGDFAARFHSGGRR